MDSMGRFARARCGGLLIVVLTCACGGTTGQENKYYDSTHADIRPTEDVDCATQVNRKEYNDLTERLRKRGFQLVMDAGAPVCRFRLASSLLVDVMPADISVLGFSNSWYAEAIDRQTST